MSRPTMPCCEVKTPDHGKIYIDRQGLAWSVDSRRLPQYDAPPAAQEPDAATVALKLVELWRDGDKRRRDAVRACAEAMGDKVNAAFRAAVSP